MDTVAFLGRVLPPQGYYSAITIQGNAPRQRFVDDIDTLADVLLRLSERGENVYYAVSSFRDVTSRSQKNVLLTKALYIDIDCGPGKPFANWKEGLVALRDFITTQNLPKPMIVSSGNGLHAYWIFDRAVEPQEWQPLANRLKAILPRDPQSGAMLFDPAVPADSARVLRAPGTINPKGGKTVTVLLAAPDVTVEDMRQALGNPAPIVVQPQRSSILSAMAVKQEFPPADPVTVERKCAQVAWAAGHQDDVEEPFWYALLGVAAFCQQPEETAFTWSNQHPGFDKAKTLNKLAQWRARATGPTTCKKFEELRPEGCKKCPLKDKIASPAGLGLQFEETPIAKDAPDETANAVPLPRPFKRSNGTIKKTIDGTDIDVCSFDIYPVGYGRDESLGYETVRYRWKRPHVGWQTLVFRQAFLPDHAAREFASTIADQGIVLFNRSQTESFQQMLRSYMDELRQLRSVTNLYSTMGWKDGNTQFLIGDTLVRHDEGGSVVRDNASMSVSIQRTADALYGTSGAPEEWAAFTALLEKANMPIHMFALCVSFSAPLYQFSGLKGLTIDLCGPTGAGKTLAQLWQQSIWGDPTKLHYTAKFTPNALFARMGLYNNLPVTIDETTMLPPKDIGDFLYWVTQGRDKARLTRSAEEREHKTWATVVTTSANRSMSSMLAASGMESDAQMARLLEITIHPHPLFTRSTDAGKKIHDFITTHYGAVGILFVEQLVAMGEAGIRAALSHHRDKFFQKYNCAFSGNERYWEQGIVLADFAGELATSLGLIQFDHSKGIKAVLTQIGAMRKVVQDNSLDSFDLLSEYLNAHAGQTLQVIHNGNAKPFVDESRLPRGELHVRYDLYGPKGSTAGPFDAGTVMLDRRHFKQWLALRGSDYRVVVREISDQGINVTPTSEKAYLGKDSPIKIGQQYVLVLSLKHARLEGILRDVDTISTNTALNVMPNVVALRKP
jgi:hypothetical protein